MNAVKPDFEVKIEQGTVDLGEVQLFYRREGDFPANTRPLLIIHGGPGLDHTYFLPYLSQIATVQPVIYFDQRGTGRSSRLTDPTGYTIEATIQDIEGLRHHWGYEQLDVLGFSYGGFVAIEYALKHPTSIRRLILGDTAPGIYFAQESATLMAARTTPALQAAKAALQAKANEMSADDFLREDFRLEIGFNYYSPPSKEITDALVDAISYGAESAKYLWEQSVANWDSRPRLGELKMPTLVICGDDDIVTPLSASQDIARLIPGAKLVVLPHAGHLSFVEAQAQFNSELVEFLA